MTHAIDLSAYLRRIDYREPVRPDLATLRQFAVAHLAAIPFENLDPWLGLPVDLEPAAVERKLVHSGRGGYCFEQNLLFMQALQSIGFEVSGLLARVLQNEPEDAITPQTHMLLRIELAGESWLADVGFGGLTLTGALRLVEDTEQPSAHEPYRLTRIDAGEADADWRMQVRLRGAWQTLYRFDLRPRHQIDYEVGNYYVSRHPTSPFVTALSVARITPDRQLGLRNREFNVHHRDGPTEKRTLRDVDELRDVLPRVSDPPVAVRGAAGRVALMVAA